MIWAALLLTSTALPTFLYAQRLRDTKIWYDYPNTASKFTTSNLRFKDTPLLTWKKYRDEYLDACLMLEGRG